MTEQQLQDSINDYWTRRAPDYDAYQQRPERRDLDVAVWADIWSAALPEAPADVLDVGTGSGHVARTIAGLGHRVTGIDLSPGMLEIAAEHAASDACAVAGSGMTPPRFLTGDAVAPDFAEQSFDAVVGRYVMWTLRDPEAAVASWVRLLRPGGVVAMADSLWFTDGLGELYGERPEGHLPLADARSIDEVADAMRRGGLVDVSVTPLEQVRELDREHGVAPGHDLVLQHLLTGRRG
ncbi:Methyltransferase domain-containing protein [Nocardioides exalbidus]|uniref:Methyltransferase domain-containing protein n=1 Tax=Nocardioides exalbidus TaxID=402596 RepID=A0A1H4WGH7_9ACTN|nr:class I SAM-dependent methyltransferase [Nocardioides exalbidus]SEC92439.1 Methyltransferase domain-containing protein [Nocardioides exalbidus]